MQAMSEIQPTTARLYQAADDLRDVKGQSAVARLLNVSPQVMKNWEARGVSEGGALLAQKIIGCDANWILSGAGAKQTTYKTTGKPANVMALHEKPADYLVSPGWPFLSFNQDDWNAMDADSKAQIETYARGLVDRALLARRKVS
jgi:hypothetical protein